MNSLIKREIRTCFRALTNSDKFIVVVYNNRLSGILDTLLFLEHITGATYSRYCTLNGKFGGYNRKILSYGGDRKYK